jgi:glycosidase
MSLFSRSCRFHAAACILAGLGFLFAGNAYAQTSNLFWQGQSIYQIITDRFYDGDTNNDNAEGTYAPGNPTGVHGGDFAGIEQKLDYIKALGATAIWISPIVLNTEGQFHGYSAWNFYEVAPHWGALSNLQALVQAAHARGLLVIDDIVVNHAGDLVTGSGSGYPTFNYPAGYTLSYVNSSKTYPAPFNLSTTNPSLTNLFHNYGNIDSFSDTNQVILGWLDGLNDFRTETPYVRSNMAAIYQYWIAQAGFDAFRVDTALEVDMGCWQSFCPAIHSFAATNGNTNFFMFAEAYNGSDTVVGPYTGKEDGGPFEFDSAVDYPLYYIINSVFATASGNTAQIEDHYDNVEAFYDPASWMQLVTFLDNHDNPRFLSTSESNGNTNELELALAFLYTARGVPCLYYGTEQGFYGTTDPNDREDMFAGLFKDGPSGSVVTLSSPGVDNFNMTHPLFLWVARLNNFRRLYPAIALGTYVYQWENSGGPGLFAYSRVLNTQEVFVVFNSASSSQTLPSCTLTYPTGTLLVNLLNTNETYTLAAGSQTPAITVPAVTAKIFIAQSQWKPLDPVVMSSSPAHWASVSNFPPIVLQFSKSMNTNSVQTAFSTTPPVSGSFTWSSVNAAHDTMTFTPTNATGLTNSTLITVRVTNSAFDAVSSNALYSPWQMQFWIGASPCSGGSGCEGSASITPASPVAGSQVTILYNPANGPLATATSVDIHLGWNGWNPSVSPDGAMTWLAASNLWKYTVTIPSTATQLNCCFNNGNGTWDNNDAANWNFTVTGLTTLIPPTNSVRTPTNGAVIAGNLQISGTASDTIAVQSVQVQLDNGLWTTASGTTSWSLNLNSSNFLNGPHVINAYATDTSGNFSTTNSVSVWFFNVPGNYVQRVSGGNPANVTDCSSNVWLEDTNYSVGAFGYTRGTNGYLDNAIIGVCSSAQSLYQRERYSTGTSGFFYQFDCPEGVYQITLLEAETYWSGPKEREFNIFIQGRQVLTNFDIYATAGGMNVPITLVFTNNVTNSQLQILFISVVDNARVSGVQVVKIANVFSDTDGIPDWWRLAYFGHALGEASDKSRGQDDADGNGISNLTKYLNGIDPLIAADVPTLAPFDITQISVTASNVKIGCSTATNWSFLLLSSSNLGAGSSWSANGPTASGTGGTVTFTDSSAPTNSTRYYRVQAR